MRKAIIPTLILLCLAGCKPVSGTVTVHGIKYEIPFIDASSADASGDTYSFTSSSLSFTEKNGKLTVNGKEFGTIKAGDTVKIDGTGRVSVNGAPRNSQ